MGKTSTNSRLNLPGKIAWITMELPGLITMFYIMWSLPRALGGSFSELPFENKTLVALFTIHYLHRAILAPLLTPSISPIHILIWLSAIAFQVLNALQIGGWLAGHGPTTKLEWSNYKSDYVAAGRMEFGLYIFFVGLIGSAFHDAELREIRHAAARNLARRQAESGADDSNSKSGIGGEAKRGKKGVEKVYMIPKNGLFIWVLYPHYLFEWIEWTGFWLMGGSSFTPARTFLVNEIVTMLPRAIEGKRWYEGRFGKENLKGKKAIIPGIL